MLASIFLASLLAGAPPTRGYPVTVEARGVAVDDLARLLTISKNLVVVIDDDARMRVSLSVRDTPWDEALSDVLMANGLGWEIRAKTMRIARRATLDEERAQRVRDQGCYYTSR